MPDLGWARSKESGVTGMRRGAWYEVVEEPGDGLLVVDVNGRRVRVPAARVTRAAEPPRQWSVVVRLGVLRPTWSSAGPGFRSTYGVCPGCRNRQEPGGRPATLTCDACGQTFPINWSETC